MTFKWKLMCSGCICCCRCCCCYNYYCCCPSQAFPVAGDVEMAGAGGGLRKTCYKSISHLAFIMREPLLSLRPRQKELDAHEMGAFLVFISFFLLENKQKRK